MGKEEPQAEENEKRGEWNRFDIVLAHYVFYSLRGCGQDSREYERLCRILEYFKPSPMGINLDEEGNENAREIYLALCERHGYKHEGGIRC